MVKKQDSQRASRVTDASRPVHVPATNNEPSADRTRDVNGRCQRTVTASAHRSQLPDDTSVVSGSTDSSFLHVHGKDNISPTHLYIRNGNAANITRQYSTSSNHSNAEQVSDGTVSDSTLINSGESTYVKRVYSSSSLSSTSSSDFSDHMRTLSSPTYSGSHGGDDTTRQHELVNLPVLI